MNEEYRRRKVEAQPAIERKYDLEDRLLEYATQVIILVEALPNTRAANHVAGQLLRSGTSPLPNHGEAQAAESPADFIHKLKVCLKELRESHRWIQLIVRAGLIKPASRADSLLRETEELTRIFVASIRTAERRKPAATVRRCGQTPPAGQVRV